jgi:methyl-accepting chemotaxis protein
MGIFDRLHFHPLHRARQMRWVLPAVGLLFVAVLASWGLLYYLGNQDVGTEFFHAHKTISHTGELLQRGLIVGVVVLVALVGAIAFWAFGVTHRIVRPVHTLHRALDELVTGNLGARLELHRHDEFQEVGAALNRLVEEFGTTLAKVHDLVDRMEVLAAEVAQEAHDNSAEVRLHALAAELNETMEFFRREPPVIIREET